MKAPIPFPLAPMLAKTMPDLPEADGPGDGFAYEPKWDGFRSIVYFDGQQVELASRGSKPLTRYFPELVEALRAELPGPCVVDGEIVVRTGPSGRERLDWDALSQRIHPAASRIRTLSEQTPASFVAFDLLADGSRSLLADPFGARRAALERVLRGARPPVHLTQTTTDAALARRWFVEFEGAGLDGVVAKPLGGRYSPGKRTMFKVKHARTADVVVTGYRVHTSGQGVGSLLLGLFDDRGELLNVGGASAFSDRRRRELIDELDPLVLRDESGRPVLGEGERSRFAAAKDVSFVRLRPELVAEVAYDHMEGLRFRHTAQFVRWRPDRDARSCTFVQLEEPAAYDLDRVLA